MRIRHGLAVQGLAVIACLGALGVVPALAQSPAETGTGGGPGSTITAPHTNSLGVTKPPGSAAGAEAPRDRSGRTPEEKTDDKIMKGICIGCGTK